MKKRTVKEAVIETFKRTKMPMTYRDIYAFIVKHDLYRFNAAVPETIVRLAIRRSCEGLTLESGHEKKYFQILPDSRYYLKNTPYDDHNLPLNNDVLLLNKEAENILAIQDELKQLHFNFKSAVKKQILSQLKQIDPVLFEFFAKKLLDVYGFTDVVVTSPSRDKGIDGHGKLKVGLTHLNVAFQCKRWGNTSVSRVEVDRFRGASQGEFEQGIIFTTSNFSKEAQQATRKSGAIPIILIDGNALIDIMIEKKFGVTIDFMPMYENALDEVLNEDRDSD